MHKTLYVVKCSLILNFNGILKLNDKMRLKQKRANDNFEVGYMGKIVEFNLPQVYCQIQKKSQWLTSFL